MNITIRTVNNLKKDNSLYMAFYKTNNSKSMKLITAILSLIFLFLNTKYYAQSIQIDQLNWSTENLNVSKFNNGDNIPKALSENDWMEACKNSTPIFIEVVNKFGKKEKLYNYYVIMDKRGVLPENTRYPIGSEFLSLSSHLTNNPGKVKTFNFILSESIDIEGCEDLSRDYKNDFWYLDPLNFSVEDALEMEMGASMAITVCRDETAFPFCEDGSFTGFRSSGSELGDGKLVRFIYINLK